MAKSHVKLEKGKDTSVPTGGRGKSTARPIKRVQPERGAPASPPKAATPPTKNSKPVVTELGPSGNQKSKAVLPAPKARIHEPQSPGKSSNGKAPAYDAAAASLAPNNRRVTKVANSGKAPPHPDPAPTVSQTTVAEERRRPGFPQPGDFIADNITIADLDDPVPKTRLNDKQLAEFRAMLLAKRAELLNDVNHLANEAFGRNRRETSGDLSSMPIHMADLGSDNWEQEFTLGLIANENALLRDIDEAVARIDDGTYGICLATHRPISVTRLRAKPWAKYCIEYARLKEQGRVP